MAKIYLAVSIGSVPVEFMFSTAGNMLKFKIINGTISS